MINAGGLEGDQDDGIADNVMFGSIGGLFQLKDPLGLTRILSNRHVGDGADLFLIRVTSINEVGNKLTVTLQQ